MPAESVLGALSTLNLLTGEKMIPNDSASDTYISKTISGTCRRFELNLDTYALRGMGCLLKWMVSR